MTFLLARYADLPNSKMETFVEMHCKMVDIAFFEKKKLNKRNSIDLEKSCALLGCSVALITHSRQIINNSQQPKNNN